MLVPREEMGKAWHWQPSHVWLPSYILCVVPRNGFGISHTRSGYLFRSPATETAYTVGSTILGIGIGGLLGIVVGMVTRLKRRSNKQIQPIAGKPGSG
jgi:ABC-type nitrate/sulfonate/bicarbonate transport system permease component